MFRGTTIIGVRTESGAALGGDGQITFGETVVKHGARKIRSLREGKVLAGFAGSTADAMTLFSKFEGKLDEHAGNIVKGAVELAREWRSDKVLRHLEALLAVVSREHSLMISGKGDVVEPDDGIVAIGSGGPFALAAARAYIASGRDDAAGIVKGALEIASQICIYTNDHITVESI
ncbi:MAG TPA: ATP-dependent protease subunit HslV [Candidatus Eisenbacteria bacterium]|uniref:ATP-dependent protease subunit HslV n=1 Tax=Eiseniibacteriota bacterium TaxID=2212470 RepID=A0A7V2AUZ5_UNCEI|nr:ATP-dependent protease subunit HslV [Candidatus Eisenbacteria bacterium]